MADLYPEIEAAMEPVRELHDRRRLLARELDAWRERRPWRWLPEWAQRRIWQRVVERRHGER